MLHRESHVKQILLLFQMAALEARGDTGAWVSTGVQDVPPVVVLGSVKQGLNARLGEAPSTCVQWLFLNPHNVLGVGV